MQTTPRGDRLAATAAASVEVVPEGAPIIAAPLEERLRIARRRRLLLALREWVVPIVLSVAALGLVAVAVVSFLAR